MRNDIPEIRRYRRPRAFAWVALCALVVFQFATAAHDSQHTIGDLADACAMCVQLDDGGNAIRTTVNQAIESPIPGYVSPLPSRVSDRRPAVLLRARAPPHA